MIWPAGGAVATVTLKRPLSSSAFFSSGVVAFQSWLFWPSMMRARIFSFGLSLVLSFAFGLSAACANEAMAAISTTTQRVMGRDGRDIGVNPLSRKKLFSRRDIVARLKTYVSLS